MQATPARSLGFVGVLVAHVAALRETYGVAGVLGRLLRLSAYSAFDYTTWVCAAFTWLNTSARATHFTGGEMAGLGEAQILGVSACFAFWTLRVVLWAAGSDLLLPRSLLELLSPAATDLDITLDAVDDTATKE
jgi:hypothetical protein